jgi:hypothetical protein
MLLVLLTPDVLNSTWVQKEIETFAKFRKRAIAPINIDDYLRKHNLDGTCLARLKDYSWIEETLQGLKTGVPSDTVLKEVLKGATKVRVKTVSRMIVIGVIMALALTSIIALVQMGQAQKQTELALSGLLGAQAELARTQAGGDLPLAATLAAESFRRAPSLQADKTLRAVLESLGREVAQFQVDRADYIGIAPDGKSVLIRESRGPIIRQYDLTSKQVREILNCEAWATCQADVSHAIRRTRRESPGRRQRDSCDAVRPNARRHKKSKSGSRSRPVFR